MIPQIKITLLNLLIILIGGPLAGAYFAYQAGELHDWAQLPGALLHGGFASFMLAIGWLLMRSPYSGRIMELLSTRTTPQGAKEETKLSIQEPVPDPPKTVVTSETK